jgi:amino acid permease
MLAEACLKTQKWSFEAVSKELYGHWLAAFTALNMFLGQGGTMVAYTIGIADGLNVFINNAHLGNSDIKWSDFATVLIIVVLTPLCLARHINFVRYLAFLGVIGLYFLAITVIYVWARYGTAETVIEDGGAGSIWIPHNSPGFMDFVNAFSTATFAFCSQFNVPQVVHELRPCTMKRITMVAWISVLMPALLYYIVLIFSLLAFGYEGNSNLEKSLTPYVRDGDVMVYIALILTVFSLCIAYIFEVFPLRQSVAFYVAHFRKRDENAPSSTDTKTLWWPTARFWDIIAGLVIIIIFSVIAFAWPSFNTFINFVGAFNGMYLAYICPSLFILKVRYREDPENFCWYSWQNLFYIAMGIFGLVMAVLGTVSAFAAS